MLEYNVEYKVLTRPYHKYAVVNPDEHLRICRTITGKEKDLLLDQWKGLDVVDPTEVAHPRAKALPKAFLRGPNTGYSCSSCPFLTIEWTKMQDHQLMMHNYGFGDSWHPPTNLRPHLNVETVSLQTIFP